MGRKKYAAYWLFALDCQHILYHSRCARYSHAFQCVAANLWPKLPRSLQKVYKRGAKYYNVVSSTPIHPLYLTLAEFFALAEAYDILDMFYGYKQSVFEECPLILKARINH